MVVSLLMILRSITCGFLIDFITSIAASMKSIRNPQVIDRRIDNRARSISYRLFQITVNQLLRLEGTLKDQAGWTDLPKECNGTNMANEESSARGKEKPVRNIAVTRLRRVNHKYLTRNPYGWSDACGRRLVTSYDMYFINIYLAKPSFVLALKARCRSICVKVNERLSRLRQSVQIKEGIN